MKLSLAIKFFFMSIFGLCVTLVLIIPLLCPFVLVFFLWYLIVLLILKVKYGDAVYKASGTDVTHGRQTDLTVPVINAAVRVHGELNVDRIKAQMLQMIETSFNTDGQKRYRRLRELYDREFGYSVWRAVENFDINNHVQVVHLINDVINDDDKLSHILKNLNDKNLDYVEMLPVEQELYIVNSQDEDTDPPFQNKERTSRFCHKSKESWNVVLKSLLNKYGGEPFPANLPPWSLLVVDEGKQTYTVLFRFHHAISDGIYFSRMFCEDILDQSVKVFQSYQPPPKIIRRLISFWAFCLLPFGIWEMISKNDSNPLHGPKLTGKKLYFVSNSLPLERFHLIKKKIKVSLHSVICSCISFAVSSHFIRRGCDVTGVTMLSPLPLQNPHKQIKLRNKFAVSSTMLPTPPPEKVVNKKPETSTGQTRSASSMMRLTQVQATLNEASQSPALLATNTLITMICSLLPEKMAKLLLSVKGCTMAVSNLPGGTEESKLWSGCLVDQIFWVPDRDPMGVGFSILSYNGCLRVGLVIDEALLQHVTEGDIIMDDFENELNNIVKELNEESDLKIPPNFFTKDESIP